MHNISEDVIKYGILATSSLDTILSFCATSEKTKFICSKPDIWKFLLLRDFNVEETSNNAEAMRVKYITMSTERDFREIDTAHLLGYLIEQMNEKGWSPVANMYNAMKERIDNPKVMESLIKMKENAIKELMGLKQTPSDVKNWIKSK